MCEYNRKVFACTHIHTHLLNAKCEDNGRRNSFEVEFHGEMKIYTYFIAPIPSFTCTNLELGDGDMVYWHLSTSQTSDLGNTFIIEYI